MAERDPNLPQSSDPELQADLVRLLQVQGPLGMLNVLDVVIPTVSMGQVVTPIVDAPGPSFRSTDVFSNGVITGPGAGAVLADTGQLSAGVYNIIAIASSLLATASARWFSLQHRNAANSASLMVFDTLYTTNTGGSTKYPPALVIGYEVSANERLRLVNVVNHPIDTAVGTIFARVR